MAFQLGIFSDLKKSNSWSLIFGMIWQILLLKVIFQLKKGQGKLGLCQKCRKVSKATLGSARPRQHCLHFKNPWRLSDQICLLLLNWKRTLKPVRERRYLWKKADFSNSPRTWMIKIILCTRYPNSNRYLHGDGTLLDACGPKLVWRHCTF